jgi:hypothetical protein
MASLSASLPPAASNLQRELERVLAGLRQRRIRSRWVLLLALPALTGLFSHLYYRNEPQLAMRHAAAALGMGALLLAIRWLAALHRRPLHEFLSAPGEIIAHFVSTDRGLVFFNAEGVFVENTRNFWTYDGPRIRILGIRFDVKHQCFRFAVAGVLPKPDGSGVTLSHPDEIVARVSADFTEARAEQLLAAVRPRLRGL